MLHIYTARFDVTENLDYFILQNSLRTKQGPRMLLIVLQ